MSFLSLLLMRTKRVLLCLRYSVVRALALAFTMTIVICSCLAVSKTTGDISIQDAAEYLVAVLISSWLIVFISEAGKYSFNAFHRFDEDIIGNAFTGLDKNSVMFEKGVEALHELYIHHALDIFTDINSSGRHFSKHEEAVLSFYRGRCYNLLGIFPNAVICYDNAAECGLDIPALPLFTARCCIETGDTERALSILMEMLDSSSPNSTGVRAEIGKLYLRLGNGEAALKWFNDSIEHGQCYADSLGGIALANIILHNNEKAEEFKRAALLNHITNPKGFIEYYKLLRDNNSADNTAG